MACFHYVNLDGSEENFESEDATIWRRSRLYGDDRPEPYQWVWVYEVTHLPELPPGFVLVRDYDQAGEVALEASESRNKVHTGRKFRLLEAKRAQRFIQSMGCELIPELYALGKAQKPKMPPASDSQSEDDVLAHPEPQEQQEPVAVGFEVISKVPINNKKKAVLFIFGQLRDSREIDGIAIERLTSDIAMRTSERFPRLGKITPQHVNYALKELKEFQPYYRQRTKSVKTFSASGDKTRYLLEGNQSDDVDSKEALDAPMDERERQAFIAQLADSQKRCGRHGN
jgi:hypothetical protein